MDPEVLFRIISDERLDSSCVAFGDPTEGILLLLPFVRMDDPLHADLVSGGISAAPSIADDNRSAGRHGK